MLQQVFHLYSNEAAKETVHIGDLTSDRALGSHVFAFFFAPF
jgi:hypothetical protein